MKKTILFILIFFSFHVFAFASTEQELFDEGVRLFKENQYQQAVDAFTKFIEISPDNAYAYKNRGVSYLKQNKFDLTLEDLDKARMLDPKLTGLYNNLGIVWYSKKEYERAIENYNIEIELSPENHVPYFNKALCLTKINRDEEAIDNLSETIRLKPDFYTAIWYKADLLAKTGKIAEAKKTYIAAIKLEPNNNLAKDKLARLNKITSKTITAEQTAEAEAEAEVMIELTAEIEAESKSQKTTKILSDYAIQAGAFIVHSNAKRMITRLLNSEFDARILNLKSKSTGRAWYMVRSGSYPDRISAKEALNAIKAKLDIELAIAPVGVWY